MLVLVFLGFIVALGGLGIYLSFVVLGVFGQSAKHGAGLVAIERGRKAQRRDRGVDTKQQSHVAESLVEIEVRDADDGTKRHPVLPSVIVNARNSLLLEMTQEGL